MRILFDKEAVDAIQESILKSLGDTIIDEALRTADRDKMPASGLYDKSWDNRQISKTRREVGNTAPYAKVVEYGAKPFIPPYAPILEWVKKKKKEEGEEAEKSAYKIVHYIQMNGLKAHRILTRAVSTAVRKHSGD
jgi:hypothetical protein